MHDKKKDTKSFRELRKSLLNSYFFDSIAKSRIYNLIKSLWWSFFEKIVNDFYLLPFFGKKPSQMLHCDACKEKRNNSYIILYTFA